MSFDRAWLSQVSRALVIPLCLLSLAACGGKSNHQPASATPAGAIGVNGYLWRATLDTLAFMPLQSADPYGGVVITDWYINPEKPNERFKVTVYKQVSDGNGGWAPAPVADQTSTDIENAILTKARQLRLSNLRG